VADLIHQGDDVRVVDNETGEDLTAATLTQIIFEQEKQHFAVLPQTRLAELVRAGGSTLALLRQALGTPLDLIQQVDNEIRRRVEALVNEDELPPTEGTRLLDRLLAMHPAVELPPEAVEELVARELATRGAPTRTELGQLLAQIEALTDKLEALERD
jgi:polyhydroxyalkanoate synthesis regulator protein